MITLIDRHPQPACKFADISHLSCMHTELTDYNTGSLLILYAACSLDNEYTELRLQFKCCVTMIMTHDHL